MSTDTASKLTELAFQYGPFFFAVLFVLGVTRWAYKVFKEVTTRTQPVPSPKDLATARIIFVGSFVVGILLVAASVVWWLGYRPRTFVFRGEIQDLQEYESLASDGMYFKTEIKSDIDGIPLRNEIFAVISDAPFMTGQVFEVEFSKNKSRRNKFRVSYDPSDLYPKYIVEWDDSSHTNVLKKQAQASVKSDWLRLFGDPIVHAAPQRASAAESADANGQAPASPRADSWIATIQDPRSDVGSKLVALDGLSTKPNEIEKKSTGTEPPLATVLDLTRHSDKEVSYKAGRVLAQIDYVGIVVQKLQSPQKQDQQDGEMIFGKLGKDDQSRVLSKLDPSLAAHWSVRANQLARTERVLPTASPQGDRYYVKATWNPGNSSAVECLSTLFNKELITDRTLDQERNLMQGRRDRVVYWYDKEWSVGMAEKIKSCGGAASYVYAPSAR
ncbi:MAG TPA: hypothetical protein VN911_04570 [Candidatus Acidoferrum sp.]|nr:hypothetical protein [Candidatus Acidoferrum sp.]